MSSDPKPDRKDVAKRLSAIATKILQEEVSPDDDSASLIKTYGADSMDIVDIIDRSEREFGITIPTEEMEGLQNFGQLCDLIVKRIQL